MKFSELIESQLKLLPEQPGVYMMKDADGEVIYVGKAKVLKNRVKSYFRGFESHDLKTQTLVVNIADFDYIVADTETEAFILEANLIKRYQPRFNILLKDDKLYPFIVVTNEEFPRVVMTRNIALFPNAKKYGPYVSAENAHKAVELMITRYKLRECTRSLDGKAERPCLNYHIGRCSAPCCGYISKDVYRSDVARAEQLLKGGVADIVVTLKQEMAVAAEALQFERAAELRDQVKALEGLTIKQRAIQANEKNQDYLAAAIHEDKACGMLFQYRNGKLLGRETFTFMNAVGFTEDAVLEAFMKQYYTGPENIPQEIYISSDIGEREKYEAWYTELLGAKVEVSVPQIGEKRRTVELVQKNAKEYVEKFQKRIEREFEQRVLAENELRALLGIGENLPLNRIEAFDISNTSGVHSVGSMVVFEGAKRKRSDYRRYRIRTVEGMDDYASIQEVIYRRYSKQVEGLPFPDLLLVDGGKGHVSAVQQVLDALKLHIPVAGMVKDDFHKTDDLIYGGKALGLQNYKKAFRLVYNIQEEVHRFAIEYHKSLRSKEMLKSDLDAIRGVGEQRKIALLKHFKSVEAIRLASEEELMQCVGINARVASDIRRYFDEKS